MSEMENIKVLSPNQNRGRSGDTGPKEAWLGTIFTETTPLSPLSKSFEGPGTGNNVLLSTHSQCRREFFGWSRKGALSPNCRERFMCKLVLD